MTSVNAKVKLLLERAPHWSEAQATAAMQAAERESELGAYLDAEQAMAPAEQDAREDEWAAGNARDAVREQPW